MSSEYDSLTIQSRELTENMLYISQGKHMLSTLLLWETKAEDANERKATLTEMSFTYPHKSLAFAWKGSLSVFLRPFSTQLLPHSVTL